ncbi:rab-GTPase-TBC domain-containing protein [Umbelopsis sp. PMI_123]|nr:rab-GTPase-TBC domain-containing protein [Umbelopsis sp. PMI_123]
MGGGPSNSPPKQMTTFDDEKQLVESTESKAQNSLTWSWEIADFLNTENDNHSNRLYPVIDNVDEEDGAHVDQYTLETPKIGKDQVQLVYAKSNFYIHPTPNTSQHVNGFIAVGRNAFSDYLFLWIPEYLIESDDLETILSIDGQRPLNINNAAIIKLRRDDDLLQITQLSNIHTLYASPPKQEKQGCFIVTTNEGDVLPSLWYHGTASGTSTSSVHDLWWVGNDIIEVMRLFLNVYQSRDDDSIYSVSEKTKEDPHRQYQQSLRSYGSSSSTITRQPLVDPIQKAVERVEQARWTILERLSHITKFSRDAANQVLGHPYAQPIVPFLPPAVQRFTANDTVRETLEDFDSASFYIAQWGIEPSERKQSKPRLPIGVEREDLDGSLLNGFEVVLANELEYVEHTRRPPVTAEGFLDKLDSEGEFKVTEGDVRQLIFQGGLDPELRIEGWKYLLGLYPWKSTYDDREAIRQSKTEEYLEIKSKWFNDAELQATSKFDEEKHRINKDVHRTDRSVTFFAAEDLPNPDPDAGSGTNANLETMKDILLTYVIAYNPELGYVQGMSDLVAPILVVMGDEAMAFWAFTHFMDRMKSNFYVDQSGMHQQLTTLESLIRFMDPLLYGHLEKCESTNLFFCFRWILIWFKREFQWGDVMKLWECIWTDYLSTSYHLFIALAILDQHRDVIIDNFRQFDEILKYVNELSMTLDLEDILERAEILFHQFRRRMDSIDNKRTELKSQLELRSVWNSDRRQIIQNDLVRLEVDHCLRLLLKRHPSLF